jgi:hypothetical protein
MQRRDERPRVYLGHNLRFFFGLRKSPGRPAHEMESLFGSVSLWHGSSLLRADYFRKDESPLTAG